MTVAELIEELQELDPNKRVLFSDTAAGYRDFKFIEKALGIQYIIYTQKPKRSKNTLMD